MSHRLTSRESSRLVWLAGLFGIAILLIAAAALQYHWNMQIRQAAETRLGADLESAMLKWHLNLYRELSTICIALEVGPDSGAQNHWNDYLRRYEAWRRVKSNSGLVENIYSNPDVVSNIYMFETSRGTDWRLLRFNPDEDKIEPSMKPAELRALLAHLQARSANLRIALRAWESDDSSRIGQPEGETQSSPADKLRTNPITGWQFDENIPAIVHPIVHHGPHLSSGQAPVDWLVIVLNRDTIRDRILPELAQRYFGSSRGLGKSE